MPQGQNLTEPQGLTGSSYSRATDKTKRLGVAQAMSARLSCLQNVATWLQMIARDAPLNLQPCEFLGIVVLQMDCSLAALGHTSRHDGLRNYLQTLLHPYTVQYALRASADGEAQVVLWLPLPELTHLPPLPMAAPPPSFATFTRTAPRPPRPAPRRTSLSRRNSMGSSPRKTASSVGSGSSSSMSFSSDKSDAEPTGLGRRQSLNPLPLSRGSPGSSFDMSPGQSPPGQSTPVRRNSLRPMNGSQSPDRESADAAPATDTDGQTPTRRRSLKPMPPPGSPELSDFQGPAPAPRRSSLSVAKTSPFTTSPRPDQDQSPREPRHAPWDRLLGDLNSRIAQVGAPSVGRGTKVGPSFRFCSSPPSPSGQVSLDNCLHSRPACLYPLRVHFAVLSIFHTPVTLPSPPVTIPSHPLDTPSALPLHSWPADMRCRRGRYRAPPRRPVSLKIGRQIQIHIPSHSRRTPFALRSHNPHTPLTAPYRRARLTHTGGTKAYPLKPVFQIQRGFAGETGARGLFGPLSLPGEPSLNLALHGLQKSYYWWPLAMLRCD